MHLSYKNTLKSINSWILWGLKNTWGLYGWQEFPEIYGKVQNNDRNNRKNCKYCPVEWVICNFFEFLCCFCLNCKIEF